MIDSWGYETSVTDPGITNDEDKARLDYIMHNQPGRLCMQHVHIAYDLGDQDGAQQYSDHLGVRADFNRRAQWCSPDDDAGSFGPEVLHFGGFSSPEDIHREPAHGSRISFAGSMQWFKIVDPGTYSIATDNNDVRFEIYEHTDLSRPISSYHGETTRWGTVFNMNKPPYYVRVFARDRGMANLPYTIKFHQHRCKSPADACILAPAVATKFTWPDASAVISPDHTTWFMFFTDTATSGRFPNVSFLQSVTGVLTLNDNPVNMKLVRDDPQNGYPSILLGGPTVDPVDGDFDNDNIKDRRFTAPGNTLAGSQQGPKKYFVQVQRDPFFHGTAFTSWLKFETDLTYFRPIWFKALEGPPGSKELTLTPDSPNCAPPGCIPAGPKHTVSLGSSSKLTRVFGKQDIVSYVESMTPSVLDVPFGVYFYSQRCWMYQWNSPSCEYIERMHPLIGGVSAHNALYLWGNAYNGDDADYWYQLRYVLGHDLAEIRDHIETKN